MKNTKSQYKKAVQLATMIHRLQSKLYNFEDELKEKNNPAAEFVGNSGFELDSSLSEIQEAINQLK